MNPATMKLLSSLLLVLVTLALLLPAGAAETAKSKSKPTERPLDPKAAPLQIAFVSYANPQQVARDSESVTKYLQRQLGVPVKGFVTLDYGSSVEAMRNSKADLAFVDPLAFMMAHEQMGARPLLVEIYSSGKPTYHSCIWVRKASGFKQPADLRGKSIAFADQVDMSGHLMPRDVFVRAGLLSAKRIEGEFFKQVYFAGGDEQAMRALFNGFTDAAGVSQSDRSCWPWTSRTRPIKPSWIGFTACKVTPKPGSPIFRKWRASPPATGSSKSPTCFPPARPNRS